MKPSIPPHSMTFSALEIQTPLGTSTAESVAAIRAGVSAVDEHTGYIPIELPDSGSEEEPLSAALESGIADFSWRRLLWLAERPTIKAIADSGMSRSQFQNAGLRFVLPHADPVVASLKLQDQFPEHFKRHFDIPDVGSTHVTSSGNAGFLVQVYNACLDILNGVHELVFIVAVDSYLLEERLYYYDEHWRVKSARNAGGFVPGEAAAVCCIESVDHAHSRGATPLFTIGEFGFGHETNPIEGSKSSTGTGYCQALTSACGAIPPNRVGWLYSDLNGEAYRGYEWGLVRSRCDALLKDGIQHVHPADTLGETGAAAGAVHLACISQAFARDYARENLAVVLSSSDSGQRAAVSVSRYYKDELYRANP